MEKIDARVIYLFVVLALALPILSGASLKPARLPAAEKLYSEVDKLQASPGKLVVIALDWGPGTTAENKPQSMLIMEHLLRKRVPFALISIYQLAAPTLRELPHEVIRKLKKELPNENWEYGKDWVNFGFQAGGKIAIQNIAKSENIQESALRVDADLVPLAELPITKNFHSIKDVLMLVQITGLVGVFNDWLQFFQTTAYRPALVHGCTSISIPDAYLYYSSGQLAGFFEGIAGAAWYDQLLSERYLQRSEVAKQVNTGLAVAQLMIIAFIVLGNIGFLIKRLQK